MDERQDKRDALRRQRERREVEERDQAARRQRRLRLVRGAGVVLLVAAAVAAIAAAIGGGGDGGESTETADTGDFPSGSVPPRRAQNLTAAAISGGCKFREFRSEGQTHVPRKVRYRENPPHSGDHDQVPTEDGAYTQLLAAENLVHALEHGRAIVWYRPGIAEAKLGSLKALYDEDPYHVLLAPRAGMPYEVAATTWTKQLGCRSLKPATFDALRAVRDQYRDRGPEYVP